MDTYFAANILLLYSWMNHLCGLAVRVPGYRSRGPGTISGATRICEKLVSLQRGPLSLVSAIEELRKRKSRASCL
jgi:hypothetical protein